MLVHAVFADIPVVLFVLLVLCAVLLSLSVPAYYHAIRPRRGTTEWIKRLDPPHFAPLQIRQPGWADIFWALLTAVCAAALRFVYYFFSLKLHLKSNALQILSSCMPRLIWQVLLSVFSALALYLLLRIMFGGKPLPALLCAMLAGFTQNAVPASTALLFASLLCLYIWMSAPYDAPLFFRAFWLLAAGLLYTPVLLLCRQAAWLAPYYLAAYLITQVLRWRGGNRERRGKKLVSSLLLTFFAFLFATLLLWLLYCLLSHRMEGSPVELLRSFRFYREMLPTLGKKLARRNDRRRLCVPCRSGVPDPPASRHAQAARHAMPVHSLSSALLSVRMAARRRPRIFGIYRRFLLRPLPVLTGKSGFDLIF